MALYTGLNSLSPPSYPVTLVHIRAVTPLGWDMAKEGPWSPQFSERVAGLMQVVNKFEIDEKGLLFKYAMGLTHFEALSAAKG